jgi:pimeloyl-ACP methyl ester carboxylesterase/HEAT repeat protein
MAKRPPNIDRLTRRRRVDGLIAALGYADWVTDQKGDAVDLGVDVRRDAVLALGLFNDVRAIEAVVGVGFADEDPRVLEAAGLALVDLLQRAEADPEYRAEVASDGGDPDGEFGAVQIARTLLLTAEESQIEAHRDLLTRVLGGGSSSVLNEAIIDEMLQALGDSRPQVVERAQRMIVLHAGDHIEPIMAAVDDPVRAAPAALALGELRENRALDVLAGGLSSTDPIVRRACAWALGELADSRGVAELFGATTDANYDVRKEAFAALDKLGSIGVIGGMATALFTRGSALPSGGWPAYGLQSGPAQQLPAGGPPPAEGYPVVGDGPDREAHVGAAFVQNLAANYGFGGARELPELPPSQTVSITAIDGTTLHAEVFGATGAPTVILAHGWGLSLRFWAHQIIDLSPEFRVVAYDLRGHGGSEPARSGDYSFDIFGDDLEAVIAATREDEPAGVLAGHSLGATSIAAWARRRDAGRRARTAALLHLGVGNVVSERLLLRIMPNRATTGGGQAGPAEPSRVHDAVIRYVAFGNATPSQVASYQGMLAECPPEVRRECLAAISDPAIHEALRSLSIPTLMVSGSLDKLAVASDVAAIANSLPQLHELLELPGTGHMGPLEQPEQISLRLRELLALARDDPRS